VASGDRIEFIELNEGRYEIVAVNQKVTALKGIVKASRTVFRASIPPFLF
jgi:hypothetical protein